jgi:hypothetical protein
MTPTQKKLSLIENKIEKLDFVFLNQIKDQLSYKNPYFLVCLNEVIHERSNDDLRANCKSQNQRR